MRSSLVGTATFAAAISAACLFGHTIHAQGRPELQVVVEDMGAASERCGLAKTSLESIAALTLRNNGVRVGTNTNPFVYVMVNPMVVGMGNRELGCAIHVDVSVRAFIFDESVRNGIGSKNKYITYCSSGQIMTSTMVGTAGLVENAIERLTKICLGQLTY